MIGYIFMLLLWVPVAVLLWRMVTSKQDWPVRLAAAPAAMLTFVGSITAPRIDGGYHIVGTREWTATAICAVGPAYLFLWSRLGHGHRRMRTISMIAAIVGFVPIAAALLFTFIYLE